MTIAWTDPEIVLAISRTESLVGAAKTLQVDHSTVFRRLNALEKSLGVRLFERLPGGRYDATVAGRTMALAAERIEEEILRLDRDLAGADLRLTGQLRVTASESLASILLLNQLIVFRKAHPGIGIELLIDNRLLDLSRREADVALRTVRPREGDLWGRKLADIAWAVYGTRSDLGLRKRRTLPRLIDEYGLIGWDENSRRVRTAEWVEKMAGHGTINYRTSSLVHQFAAVKRGMGIAALPCYMGDLEPELTRAVPEPLNELQDELWIITHVTMKDTARVRAFFDIVGGGLGSECDLIAGRRPHAARPSRRP